MNFDVVLNKYLQFNYEELSNIEELNKNNKYPVLKDLAQVVEAKSYLKDGMILVRKHPRFCYVKKHKHNYLEINYVLKGEVTQILDQKEINLKEGELLFISKNSHHEFLPAKEGDLLLNFIVLPEFFDFLFPFLDKNGNLKKFLINLLSNKDESNSILFHTSDNDVIQNIIKNILITFEEKDQRMNDLIRQYFQLLIFELLKHTEYAEESGHANYDSIILFKTYNYIENNYSTGSLTEFAKLSNENYNYLSKRIKKLTGLSFQKLIENERIKASKILLESTDINVNDIAYHVGYNNLTFFYHLFKNNVGISPLEYRNKNKTATSN